MTTLARPAAAEGAGRAEVDGGGGGRGRGPMSNEEEEAAAGVVDPFGVVLNDFLSDLSFCPKEATMEPSSAAVQHVASTPPDENAAAAPDGSSSSKERNGVGPPTDEASLSQVLLLSDGELTFSSLASLEELSPVQKKENQSMSKGTTPPPPGGHEDGAVADSFSSKTGMDQELEPSGPGTSQGPLHVHSSSSSSSFTSISVIIPVTNDDMRPPTPVSVGTDPDLTDNDADDNQDRDRTNNIHGVIVAQSACCDNDEDGDNDENASHRTRPCGTDDPEARTTIGTDPENGEEALGAIRTPSLLDAVDGGTNPLETKSQPGRDEAMPDRGAATAKGATPSAPFCVKSWLEASGDLLERHLERRHGGSNDMDDEEFEADMEIDDEDMEIEEVSATEVEVIDDTSDAADDHDGSIPTAIPRLPQHMDVQAWLEASGGLLEKHLMHRQRRISTSNGEEVLREHPHLRQPMDVHAWLESSGGVLEKHLIHRQNRISTSSGDEILPSAPSSAHATALPSITTEPGGVTQEVLPRASSDPDVTSWLQLAGAKLEQHLQQRLLSRPEFSAGNGVRATDAPNDDDASAMTDIEVVDDDHHDSDAKDDLGNLSNGRPHVVSSINMDEWLASSGNRLETHLLQRQERMQQMHLSLDADHSNGNQRGMPAVSVRAWLQASGGMLEQHLLQRSNQEKPSHAQRVGSDDNDSPGRVDPDEDDVPSSGLARGTENPVSASAAVSVERVRDWLQDASSILERKIQQRRQSMAAAVQVDEEIEEVEDVILENEHENDLHSSNAESSEASLLNDSHSVIQPHAEQGPYCGVDKEEQSADEGSTDVSDFLEPTPAKPSPGVQNSLASQQTEMNESMLHRENAAEAEILHESRDVGQNLEGEGQQTSRPPTVARDRPERADIRDWLERSAGELELRLQDRVGLPARAHASEYDEVTVIDDDILDDDDEAEPESAEPASPKKVDVRSWLETTASLLDRKLQTRPQPSTEDQYDEITIVDDEPVAYKPSASMRNPAPGHQAFDEETVIEEIEEEVDEESGDEEDDNGSSEAMDSSSSAYEEPPPQESKGELPPNVREWMESTALLIQQLQLLKGSKQGEQSEEGGVRATSSCHDDMQGPTSEDGSVSEGSMRMRERSSTDFDGASVPADTLSGASDHSQSQEWASQSFRHSQSYGESSQFDPEGSQDELDDGAASTSEQSSSRLSLRDNGSSNDDFEGSGVDDGEECDDFSENDNERASIPQETREPSPRPVESGSSNLFPPMQNRLSSKSKPRHAKMGLGGLGNFLESKLQQRQQDYCKSVHLEAEDDESESDEGEEKAGDRRSSTSPQHRSRLTSVPESSDAGSVPASPYSSTALSASSPRRTVDASPLPTTPVTTTTTSPLSPIRRTSKASIPAAPYSFSAVSVSFLATNVKATTATKVFEEALRILRPGGRVYLVDYDGRTVNKLPLEWRNLLKRVDQFDPDEMQLHGMQEEEIRKILSCVGSAKSAHCLDQGYALARWVGVLPPDFSWY